MDMLGNPIDLHELSMLSVKFSWSERQDLNLLRLDPQLATPSPGPSSLPAEALVIWRRFLIVAAFYWGNLFSGKLLIPYKSKDTPNDQKD